MEGVALLERQEGFKQKVIPEWVLQQKGRVLQIRDRLDMSGKSNNVKDWENHKKNMCLCGRS